MSAREDHYLSFLLRLWLLKRNSHNVWRASLDDPLTGERRNFASIEALMEFLSAQLETEQAEHPTDPHRQKENGG